MLALVTLIFQASTSTTVCHHVSSQVLKKPLNKLNTAVKLRHAMLTQWTTQTKQLPQNSSKLQLSVLPRMVTSLSVHSTTKASHGNHAMLMLAMVCSLMVTTFMLWLSSTHTQLDAGALLTLIKNLLHAQQTQRPVWDLMPPVYTQLHFSLWFLEY